MLQTVGGYGGCVGQVFRAGVVVVVRHPDRRRILAFERADIGGNWQLPQGGLDLGEDPLDAAWRELLEETGLDQHSVIARAEFPEWTVYEWPQGLPIEKSKGGKRRGQVQRWFLFDALTDDIEPTPDGSEFVAWQWVEPRWLIDHVPDWRRDSYAKVLTTL